ncbi:hypothetical protein P8452_63487 [Trifolium repens]|nr:hypothetical protein P8452_63487 [Trifolium repens]
MGKKELPFTILLVWLIQNERGRVQSYIQKKLSDDKKDCYLAPYLNNHHWQLLIINPKKLEVVFLCSLGKKPDKKITDIVEIALGAYAKLQVLLVHGPKYFGIQIHLIRTKLKMLKNVVQR